MLKMPQIEFGESAKSPKDLGYVGKKNPLLGIPSFLVFHTLLQSIQGNIFCRNKKNRFLSRPLINPHNSRTMCAQAFEKKICIISSEDEIIKAFLMLIRVHIFNTNQKGL
jgi:hypothetical protein